MTAPYYSDDLVTLYHGDCIEVMRTLPDNSVHAVVTDPPYGLEFMGKGWDGADGFRRSLNAADAGRENAFGRASRTSPEYKAGRLFGEWCEVWAAEAFRILKPGGHILAFGGTRTWQRLAVAVEDSGFEIRDSIAWLYGSGFPKVKTVLKPAFEPIVVGRKPFSGTLTANVLANGTGAFDIEATRTAFANAADLAESTGKNQHAKFGTEPGQNNVYGDYSQTEMKDYDGSKGRWPTNVLLDDSQANELDAQTGISQSRIGKPRGAASGEGWGMTATGTEYDDAGGASRFFPTFHYEAKAPNTERPTVNGVQHPTVKPLELMRWLVRLVTPPGGTVLEPFAGSGTTLEACLIEGFDVIGIEREDAYLPLIMQRIKKPLQQSMFGDEFA
ncbi:DNA-methyltransferase [Cryobacterium soli]|uniref:DNA-methyltransferase n=1 Tax=Cryobacterium soli TaxID=2220095 RepID=UPI000E70AD90|nr:site-specific DNA-methyltransferase [Cryobacterium soli]